MARWLILALALVLPRGVRAQSAFTIDFTQPRQTIQGLGITATGTWIPEVAALYGKQSFADTIREDLGASIIRLALPPEIQTNEELDATTLNLDTFDFTKFNPPAKFIQTLHKADPALKVILSIWSPPAWMKTNASTKDGGRLRRERREHFAKFCAAACLGFEKTYGVPIHALSIQNEPHFVQTYDSCIYTPEEMRDTIPHIAAAFKRWEVRTRLAAPEDFADEPRWMKYVAAMATPATLPALSILNVHGQPEHARGAAARWPLFHDLARKTGLPLWMTETSGELPTWLGTRLELGEQGKPGALELARAIHDALVHGQCEAWIYWAISDPAESEFALMALDKPTPKFHAASHYFKFIRPGARCIEVKATQPSPTILVSAFHHADRHQVTIVLINMGAAAATVKLSLNSPPGALEFFDPIRSSSTESAAPLEPITVRDRELSVMSPAQSVTTLLTRY